MNGRITEPIAEALRYLTRPDCDFLWSRWQGAPQAIAELRELAASASLGDHAALSKLDLLFAPTGALQDLFNVNGWGDEFLRIADGFDSVRRNI
ncbi:hypothetical protein JJJ17_07450 [Paracoccus caeni]|uniref:Uncharacterized protein n=1 Tax=Paracoccus caeni TaxID=657651 RepID=A0A934SEY9_9RHOB|nr:hypothetical protein [Paracoccus caeni]MBK4215756.1 hypothetical protein [Paracoccus caeni]